LTGLGCGRLSGASGSWEVRVPWPGAQAWWGPWVGELWEAGRVQELWGLLGRVPHAVPGSSLKALVANSGLCCCPPADGGKHVTYIIRSHVKDHYIFYCEGELHGKPIRGVKLVGRDPENNLEALEDFE
uniref:Lipocalin/cytosolic fatty-acid binding domain-containing protein n=1 Tax=Macaca fascicularis TaxID=9541 RepID=A0A7N9CKT1_MACFA